MPLANVEDAVAEVMLRTLAARPPVNVDVPVPCTVRNPVVVAPPKIVRPVDCVPPPIVEDAVASRLVRKEVPETVIAVDETRGKTDGDVRLVAMKLFAVGVEVPTTKPFAFVARIEFALVLVVLRVSCPRELNDDVAVAPKYALLYAEKMVVEAPA